MTLVHTLREVAAAELDWALAVLRRLSGSVLAALGRTEELLGAEGVAVFLRVHILELIDSLREREMLPAIFFRQSQSGCEVLAQAALARLEAAEAEARKGREGEMDKARRRLEKMEEARRKFLDRLRDRPREEWTPEENEAEQKADGQIAALRAKTDDVAVAREFTMLPPGAASIQVRFLRAGTGQGARCLSRSCHALRSPAVDGAVRDHKEGRGDDPQLHPRPRPPRRAHEEAPLDLASAAARRRVPPPGAQDRVPPRRRVLLPHEAPLARLCDRHAGPGHQHAVPQVGGWGGRKGGGCGQ